MNVWFRVNGNETNKVYYLYTVVCMRNNYLKEAEKMLNLIYVDKRHVDYVPTGVIYFQLAKIFKLCGNRDKAVKYFKLTIKKKYQPLLFLAFLELSDLGISHDYLSDDSMLEKSVNLSINKTPDDKIIKGNPSQAPPQINQKKRYDRVSGVRDSTFNVPKALTELNFNNKNNNEYFYLFQTMANAYLSYCQYDVTTAIQHLNKLPSVFLQKSGWVLSILCKCYHRLESYKSSEKLFKKLIQLENWRLKNLDIYSTVLWHLKKNVELNKLVAHMRGINPYSIYTLVAIGNAYSLEGNHRNAIKYFEKVNRINPRYTYAYVLTGHEYLETDQVEPAKSAFQSAINVNPRDYNAWYGLGMIYLRKEQWDVAKIHFNNASCLNPSSAIALTYLGMAECNDSNYKAALDIYDRALKVSPGNPFSLLKKAEVLIHLKEYKAAIKILENDLVKHYSIEPSIYKQLGDAYQYLGEKEKSMSYYQKSLYLKQRNTVYTNEMLENYLI